MQFSKTSKDTDTPDNLPKTRYPVPMDIKKHAIQSVSTRKNLIMIDLEALPIKMHSAAEVGPRSQIILWIQEILYDKNNIVVIMTDSDRA